MFDIYNTSWSKEENNLYWSARVPVIIRNMLKIPYEGSNMKPNSHIYNRALARSLETILNYRVFATPREIEFIRVTGTKLYEENEELIGNPWEDIEMDIQVHQLINASLKDSLVKSPVHLDWIMDTRQGGMWLRKERDRKSSKPMY